MYLTALDQRKREEIDKKAQLHSKLFLGMQDDFFYYTQTVKMLTDADDKVIIFLHESYDAPE